MSLEVLTMGGGGESASIFVTGLSETDTVSASKDGKTVNGRWTQKPNPALRNLPDGYTQLEYIEGTGTQYIDTRYNPNNNTRVLIDLESFATTNRPRMWFGVRKKLSGGRLGLNLGNNSSLDYTIYGHYGTDYSSCTFAFNQSQYNERRTIDFNKNVLTMSTGHAHTFTAETYQMDIPMYLFGFNDPDWAGGAGGLCEMRLYSCKVYDDGTLVRDYVPAKNGNGAVGLYDIVNDVFCTNAGTGEFIAGEFDYGFRISPIKSFGMWTVTATNSKQTAIQDVLVDAAIEYEIEMAYKLWLE